jgi:hypothetical protein
MSNKDGTGEYFSKSDQEHVAPEKELSRHEKNKHSQLRNQFLEKAKKFMDDSPLGESKNLLNTLMGKDEPPEEAIVASSAELEEDWDDDDWDGEEEEEFDYSAPETIRVGYAKPGSNPPPKRKTVEEARDESFDLKLGALSGLLNRFGAERVEEEISEVKQAMHIDIELFKNSMKHVYAQMAAQSGESPDTDWLRPELLSLLRLANSPEVIMEFIIAALFASTPENFMTQSDIAYVCRLLVQIGIDLPAADVEEAIGQTFLFAERVHRLYTKLVESPPQLEPSQVARQKENLAKLFIHQVAQFYQTDHKTVIRALAEKWTTYCQNLAKILIEIERINQQLSLFKERKTASSTILNKLLRAEQMALTEWQQLTYLAHDISALKKVTLLLEEHEALAKLEIFPLQYLLDDETSWAQSPSWEEIQTIFALFQARKQRNSVDKAVSPPVAIQLDLSPLNQKKIVTRSKSGEVKALKEIDSYKRARIAQIQLDLDKNSLASTSARPHQSP